MENLDTSSNKMSTSKLVEVEETTKEGKPDELLMFANNDAKSGVNEISIDKVNDEALTPPAEIQQLLNEIRNFGTKKNETESAGFGRQASLLDDSNLDDMLKSTYTHDVPEDGASKSLISPSQPQPVYEDSSNSLSDFLGGFVPTSADVTTHKETVPELYSKSKIDTMSASAFEYEDDLKYLDTLSMPSVEKQKEESTKPALDGMSSSMFQSALSENNENFDSDSSLPSSHSPDISATGMKYEEKYSLPPLNDDFLVAQQPKPTSKVEKSDSFSSIASDDILVPTVVSKSSVESSFSPNDGQSDTGSTLKKPSKCEVTFSDIGPNEFFSTYGLDMWFHPERLNPAVEAYIYWRDPKLSGIVFGSGLVLLLSLAYFSFISVVANTGLGILVCAIIVRLYKDILQAVQKTPQTHLYSGFLSQDIQLPQEKIQELIDAAIVHINACLAEFRRLFLVEDMIESLKLALVLWVLTYIGSWFNGLTLVIIGFVSLFTLPKVYENNKVQIDQNLNLVRVKLEELTGKIKDALPAPLRRKLPEKKE